MFNAFKEKVENCFFILTYKPYFFVALNYLSKFLTEECSLTDCVEHHRLASFRWSPQRRLERVPDQPGALPQDPLPARHLCSDNLQREGFPRAVVRCRNNQLLLRAVQPDGEMRSTPWQVHGLLSALPRRCCAEGREQCHRDHQDKEVHPVRRLVPDRIQSWHQLPGIIFISELSYFNC